MKTMAILLVVVLLAAGAVTAADPLPDGVVIGDFTYVGSGCPPGTVAAELTPDGQRLLLVFTALDTARDGALPLPQNRKACQLHVGFLAPSGYTYAVLATESNGHARLRAGVRGRHKTAHYYHPGPQIDPPWPVHNFVGPLDTEWQYTESVHSEWSPCSAPRRLLINTQVGAFGNVEPDDSTGVSHQTYQLAWGPCPLP